MVPGLGAATGTVGAGRISGSTSPQLSQTAALSELTLWQFGHLRSFFAEGGLKHICDTPFQHCSNCSGGAGGTPDRVRIPASPWSKGLTSFLGIVDLTPSPLP